MQNQQAAPVITSLIESIEGVRNAAREADQLRDIFAACIAAGYACSTKLFNAARDESEEAQATVTENMHELDDALAAARAYVAVAA